MGEGEGDTYFLKSSRCVCVDVGKGEGVGEHVGEGDTYFLKSSRCVCVWV